MYIEEVTRVINEHPSFQERWRLTAVYRSIVQDLEHILEETAEAIENGDN